MLRGGGMHAGSGVVKDETTNAFNAQVSLPHSAGNDEGWPQSFASHACSEDGALLGGVMH
jgi:hypothetical protein